MKIDLSPSNQDLYAGCEFLETLDGHFYLRTPVNDAVKHVERNIKNILSHVDFTKETEVTLTGKMLVWAYAVIFHAVVDRFLKVYYDDGRPSGPVLISQRHQYTYVNK